MALTLSRPGPEPAAATPKGFPILILLERDEYVRNFITSGAFDRVLAGGEAVICTSDAVKAMSAALPESVLGGSYRRSIRNEGLIHHFFQVSMRALRKRSATLDVKTRVGWPGKQRLSLLCGYTLLSLPPFYGLLKGRMAGLFEIDPALEELVRRHAPGLVVFPLTGVEGTAPALVKLSRKYGFKTLFLQNGWDNLSSKGVFPLLPDYLGVWGPQSLMDAVSIQGMPDHRLFTLGSAKYEDYLRRTNAEHSPFSHPYVLFAGSFTPCDEVAPLRVLEEVLDERGETGLKVVYRPHPWRGEKHHASEVFRPQEFRHVVLDPQVAAEYLKQVNAGDDAPFFPTNYPPLDYYPSLLNHARFVVSPMSSMVLEAALYDVPAIVLAHRDDTHLISPHLQARYRHFEGGEEVPGWFYIRDLEALRTRFRQALRDLAGEGPEQRGFRPALSTAVRHYLFRDGRSYAEHLGDAVEVIRARARQERMV
jgi:hypothetical protein